MSEGDSFEELPVPDPQFSLSHLEDIISLKFDNYLTSCDKLRVYRDVKAEFRLSEITPGFSTERLLILRGNLIEARTAFWEVFERGAGFLTLHSVYSGFAHGITDVPAPDSPTASTAYVVAKANGIIKKYIPVIENAIDCVSSRISS